jgi:hypothetical protein
MMTFLALGPNNKKADHQRLEVGEGNSREFEDQ